MDDTARKWCASLEEQIKNGGSGSGVSYSMEEQNTGLKWINGKAIYQKTFAFTNPIGITASGNNVTHTDFMVIDKILGIEYYREHHGSYTSDAWGTGLITHTSGSDTVTMYSSEGVGDCTHFTIRYTKTTD